MIRVSWPKKSSGVATDVTEDRIRDLALPMGLVDVKVCAVNETSRDSSSFSARSFEKRLSSR